MAAPHSQACHPLARTPAAPYPAHMKVVGNNGVWMYGAANCWMRRIHIVDADTGAEAINSDFITMQGISFEVTKKR